MFDGWAIYSFDANSLNATQERSFTIYQHLLLLNEKLRCAWIEAKMLSIQDRLKLRQSQDFRDPFLEVNSLPDLILSIEMEILTIERAYRFLSDLKRYADDSEQSTFIECARQMGANSGWPPSLIDYLDWDWEKR